MATGTMTMGRSAPQTIGTWIPVEVNSSAGRECLIFADNRRKRSRHSVFPGRGRADLHNTRVALQSSKSRPKKVITPQNHSTTTQDCQETPGTDPNSGSPDTAIGASLKSGAGGGISGEVPAADPDNRFASGSPIAVPAAGSERAGALPADNRKTNVATAAENTTANVATAATYRCEAECTSRRTPASNSAAKAPCQRKWTNVHPIALIVSKLLISASSLLTAKPRLPTDRASPGFPPTPLANCVPRRGPAWPVGSGCHRKHPGASAAPVGAASSRR